MGDHAASGKDGSQTNCDDGVMKPPKITHLDQKELDSQGQETGFPFLERIVRLLDVIMSTLCSLNDHNLNNNL